MPALTLKDIPRDLHRDLKKRAAANHRSLNKELIAMLRAATAPPNSLNLAALERDARQARTGFTRRVTAREISAWKRKGRL
jgi:plasmid stability protein